MVDGEQIKGGSGEWVEAGRAHGLLVTSDNVHHIMIIVSLYRDAASGLEGVQVSTLIGERGAACSVEMHRDSLARGEAFRGVQIYFLSELSPRPSPSPRSTGKWADWQIPDDAPPCLLLLF